MSFEDILHISSCCFQKRAFALSPITISAFHWTPLWFRQFEERCRAQHGSEEQYGPIGTAVDSSIPTSGDTIEPSIKGGKPMTALALPAR